MATARIVGTLFTKQYRATQNFCSLIKRETYSRTLNYFSNSAARFNDDVNNASGVNYENSAVHFELESFQKLRLTEDELLQYPIQRFAGNIHIVNKPSHEHDSHILNILNKLKHETVLGLDVETSETNWVTGCNKQRKKTRVVQVASETDAIVWQLKNFATLPSSLVFFLTSDILKVGHAISDDVVLLKKEFDVTSRCLLDTLPWAIQLKCKPLGLHALCAIFLGWRISKRLQTSDWSRSDLSENQIYYACTDAWASLVVYKEMKRVAGNNGCILPLPIESVTDILDTRLDSRRKRRHRLLQNYKARKNFGIMAKTCQETVE